MVNSRSWGAASARASSEVTVWIDGERPPKRIARASATLGSNRSSAKPAIQQSADPLTHKETGYLSGRSSLVPPPGARLDELSACTVHEINQPVAALVTNAQAALRFLAGQNPNLDEVRHALSRVLQLGQRIGEIVDRTRALAQRVAPRKDDFELNDAIQETISLNQEALLKNDVSVHTRFAQGLPLVRADRVQLQQVILNLITNAVEAMSGVSEGTRELSVSTGRTNSGDMLVAVQDSGPGLDRENLDRLFDAFYSTKPCGMGIGLSICRSIIEAHKGRLWASRTEPHGATFQFTLPQVRSNSYREFCSTPRKSTSQRAQRANLHN